MATYIGTEDSETIVGDRNFPGEADLILGLGGNDVLSGLAGRDRLDGGDGNDTIYAEDADTVRGGNGNDLIVFAGTLIGGDIDGGPGEGDVLSFDDAVFDRRSGSAKFTGFERLLSGSLTGTGGADTLDLSSITATTNPGGFAVTLTIRAGDGVDTIVGGAERDTIYGEGGADIIDGGGGSDTLFADGADILRGGDGNDTIAYARVVIAGTADGGAGTNDLLVFDDARFDRDTGSSRFDGFERLLSGSLTGTGGADTLDLSSITARTNPGGFAVTLTIRAGDGADTLTGGAERDVIYGEGGADIITGGGGEDVMSGGAGRDTFRFGVGDSASSPVTADTITDFSKAERDRIDLTAIDGNSNTPGFEALTFIGTAAFSGRARELRYQISGEDTLLSGDTDGDSRADFMVRLNGQIALTRSDIFVRPVEAAPVPEWQGDPFAFARSWTRHNDLPGIVSDILV